MKVKITGASGYIGKLIANKLSKTGNQVSGIKRESLYGGLEELKNEIRACDVIINLAGVSILKRWTKRNKKSIYDSRVQTTKNLVAAINDLSKEDRPKKFISASAIGIYKADEIHTENSTNFEKGFVANVIKHWESPLNNLPDSIQRNIFRIGMVLGKDAKTIKNLIVPFKRGFGATLGNGEQAFPFIHEKDLVKAFVWAIENKTEGGVYNLVSPTNITNKAFTLALAKQLNRSAFLSIPAFLLKAFLGEASALLLDSPIVKPKALLDAGFKFEYPTMTLALSEILT